MADVLKWNLIHFSKVKSQIRRCPQRIILIWLLLVWQYLSPFAHGQGFACDGSFYYVATEENKGSQLFRLTVHENDQIFETEAIPLDNPLDRHITCLGYNVKDQKIYGLDFNSYELLRLNGDGSMESLGVPENLDTTFVFYAGEMTPDGRRLVVLARNRISGEDERIYSIRVNGDSPDYYAGFFSVISDAPVSMSDITVDPVVGVTYGYDLLKGQIIETDRTGLTSTNHRPFERLSQNFGSLFFDRNGQMYGLGSASRGGGTQNQIHKISKLDGNTLELATTNGGFDTDGCSCPYTVKFFKTIDPPEIIGCDQIKIHYNVLNQAGIGQVGINIIDMLPAGFKIQDIIMPNLFNIRIMSGVGTDFLDLDRWTLLLGANPITLVVDVPFSSPQVLGSHGQLNNLPFALEATILSDDPKTTVLADQSDLKILGISALSLEENKSSSCDLDTVFLSLPVNGNFIWSDGSMQPTLSVTEEGTYSVSVTNQCYSFQDTIVIVKDSTPLYVDLGENLDLNLGDEINLAYSTNATSIREIEWSSHSNLLSCSDCPNPQLQALASGMVSVTLVDERGCGVTDQLQVHVDQTKRIYVPTAFTPDGDGINDLLVLLGNTGRVESFQVFDRWGNLVYSRSGYDLSDQNKGWDGKVGGSKARSGVYIWTASILFTDQVVQQLYGECALIH